MIDTLRQQSAAAEALAVWQRFASSEQGYAVATLHRPSNVDDDATLGALMQSLADTSALLPVIFPVHPRTRARLDTMALTFPTRLHLCEPLPYLEFLSLTMKARLVLTDSGGIQEETTCLGVPCLTLRENTERPITVTHGTNRVIGTRPEVILKEVRNVLRRPMPAAVSSSAVGRRCSHSHRRSHRTGVRAAGGSQASRPVPFTCEFSSSRTTSLRKSTRRRTGRTSTAARGRPPGTRCTSSRACRAIPLACPFPATGADGISHEQIDGIHVHRVWTHLAPNRGVFRRTVNYLSFVPSALFRSWRLGRFDVLVGTSPQFFCPVATWLAAVVRRTPWVFELRDLWPESISAVGAMHKSLPLRLLERLELRMYRNASAVVCLTRAFMENLESPRHRFSKVEIRAERDRPLILGKRLPRQGPRTARAHGGRDRRQLRGNDRHGARSRDDA